MFQFENFLLFCYNILSIILSEKFKNSKSERLENNNYIITLRQIIDFLKEVINLLLIHFFVKYFSLNFFTVKIRILISDNNKWYIK